MTNESQIYKMETDCQLHQGHRALLTCITCGKMICSNCNQHEAAEHKVTQLPKLNIFLEAISQLDVEEIDYNDLEGNIQVIYESIEINLKKFQKTLQNYYSKIKVQLPKYKLYIEEVNKIKQYVAKYKSYNLTQQLSALSFDIAKYLYITPSYIKLNSQQELLVKISQTVPLLQSIDTQFSGFIKQMQSEGTEIIVAPTYYLDEFEEKIQIEQPRVVNLLNEEINHSQQPCFVSKKGTSQIQGRVEKQMSMGGGKCWYMDLNYPRPSQKVIEIQQCCILCKTHPEFVKLKLHIQKLRFGDLCGPIALPDFQRVRLQEAFSKRTDQDDIGNNREIYFHEICVYWSSGIICDEIQGEVNIDTLVRCVINSVKQTCHLCKWPGATIRCNQPTCPISVHYGCFKHLQENNQRLDPHEKFRIRCPLHYRRPYIKPTWCNNETVGGDSKYQKKKKQKFEDAYIKEQC